MPTFQAEEDGIVRVPIDLSTGTTTIYKNGIQIQDDPALL
jgi:hypothetical protein